MKFVFLLLISISSIFFSQPRKIEYDRFSLDNGLKVILHQDHTTPIVAISVTYHVGSKNEHPDRTGFAHFFEHLMFEGSKYISRGELDEIFENAGAEYNAYTNQDKTFYYQVLPSNRLELGLWLESERMLHLKIDSIGIETQRKVVKEERKQSIDNKPYGSLFEETFKRAFKVHPYKWTTIGSTQYIDKATIDEFTEFYKTYYVPDNAILSIAGDIDISQTKKLITKYFATIPSGKIKFTRPLKNEPKLSKEIRDIVYDKIQLPLVVLAYRIPEQTNPDYYSLDMLSRILSSGETSRLKKSLIDKKQLSISTGSFQYSLEHPGLFIIYAFANSDIKPETLEKAMEEEINAIKSKLISDFETEKLKNQIQMEFITENSTVSGIAENLAHFDLIYGNADLINKEVDMYLSIKPEDIKNTASKYLNPSNRVVLYYLPKK